MLNSTATSNLFRYICGFLLGAMLVFTLAFDDDDKQDVDVVDLENIKSAVYGDLRFDVIEDPNYMDFPELPELKEGLLIRKNESPFIMLYKDSSINKIKRWGVMNGFEEVVLTSEFDKGKILKIAVYGNKVYDNQRMPVFMLKASDKPGVWRHAIYIALSKAIMENGKLKSFLPNGEMYVDIDFDGQFDAKSDLTTVSNDMYYLAQSIYIDGKWKELGRRDSNGEWQKIGGYDVESLEEADEIVGGKKIYYDFEIGKGWKRRSDAKIN
jgi:hypothetical protein